MNSPDQLCWHCSKSANYHKCCWAGGVPRTDWVATPTIIQNQKVEPVHSFIVHECPDYDPDARELARIENDSNKTTI